MTSGSPGRTRANIVVDGAAWSFPSAADRPLIAGWQQRSFRSLLFAAFLTLLQAPLSGEQVTVRTSRELAKALANVSAGDDIVLLPGTYDGDMHFSGLRGSDAAPVRIRGAFPDQPPVLRLPDDGARLTNSAFLSLESLVIHSERGNALTIVHQAPTEIAPQHLLLKDVTLRTSARDGRACSLRMDGVTNFTLDRCRIESSGSEVGGCELAGCQNGRLVGCTFTGSASQVSGLTLCDSRSIVVNACRFVGYSSACVQLGSQGGACPDAGATEVTTDVDIHNSEFAPSAITFSIGTARNILIHRNIIYRPRHGLVGFFPQPSQRPVKPGDVGCFSENIVVWRGDELDAVIKGSDGAQAQPLELARNLWYCEDISRSSMPPLHEAVEVDGVYGENPQLVDPANGDIRALRTVEGMRAAASRRTPLESWGRLLWRPGWQTLICLAGVAALRFIRLPNRSLQPHVNSGPPAETDVRRALFFAALVLAGLFIYGSLLPFYYRWQDWPEIMRQWHALPLLTIDVYHLADWMANLLLFVPIGFCAAAATGFGRCPPVLVGLRLMGIFMAVCGLIVSVEWAQLLFPPRTVSQNDIYAEGLGAVVGGAAGLAFGATCIEWWRKIATTTLPHRRVAAWLQIYLALFVVYALLPLDFVRSAEDLSLKWQAGRIRWAWDWASDGVMTLAFQLIVQLALSLPAGIAIGHWQLTHRPTGWKRNSIAVCGLAALLVEACQILVFTRYAVFLSALWSTLGMVLGAQLSPYLNSQFDMYWTSAAACRRRWPVTLMIAGYSAAALWMVARPSAMLPEPGVIAERLQGFWSPPFASLYWGSEFAALTATLQGLGLFLPLGFAMADAAHGFGGCTPTRRPWVLAAAILGGLSAAFELLQAWRVDATVDATNTLLYLVGGCLGWRLRCSLADVMETLPGHSINTLAPRFSLGSVVDFGVIAGISAVLTAQICSEAVSRVA